MKKNAEISEHFCAEINSISHVLFEVLLFVIWVSVGIKKKSYILILERQI